MSKLVRSIPDDTSYGGYHTAGTDREANGSETRKGTPRKYSRALARGHELNLLQLSHSLRFNSPRNRCCSPLQSDLIFSRGNARARGGWGTAMDAAPVLKRKGAEAAAETPWVDVDGLPIPAAKIRRLDADVPPVGPGVGIPQQQQQGFGLEEARVSGGVAARTAVDASQLLKRKGAEAPQPWLGVDGSADWYASPPFPVLSIVPTAEDAEVPPVEHAVGVPRAEPGAVVAPQPFVAEAAPAVAVSVAAPAVNDERAIVVYQPAEAARNLLEGPLRPAPSLRVNPNWIHGLRSTMLQEASNHRTLFEELAARDENLILAVIYGHAASSSAAAAATEMMDADQEGDGASMEVEHQPAPPAGGVLQGAVFQQQQWLTQHCVAPQQLQLPAASYQPSPVTWSW
ncbi:hypothetical protein HU200_037985 [Digitaria exilis]|uniref:Uncharacterized protein n=1 Tax=Digitaria exilis TaxID=1010633 RepID=A0A835BCL8_9POAL|nr:hypothetical protein HU200_037985 [Digitaria exilis]